MQNRVPGTAIPKASNRESKLHHPVLLGAEVPLRPATRALSEDDAVDVWIARWLRIRRKDLVQRYGCDPRRLYEVWEGRKHPAARDRALARFREEYPTLLDRVDFGAHRRIPRVVENSEQMSLFDD